MHLIDSISIEQSSQNLASAQMDLPFQDSTHLSIITRLFEQLVLQMVFVRL
jgi:hypothetical protein